MTALISRDELKKRIDDRSVTVVDALGGSYYEQQHLPGAVALTADEVADRAAEVLPDKDALIAVYCSNPACGNSQAVSTALEGLGYTQVRKYREGIQDWVEGGLPVDRG
ncbi:rhodanese-like domain-containing protein [Nocardiopsis sp. YSL2]|uniref:rhodanese-like domain-containing protein n=1 Tax=Nocardiopsis sp. YSL2 TaxID=2939492 RepID=UPI0026F44264|nr:rhodanese-like domain-containing protein [Nocardiopsis sp. YSL2]